MFLSLAMVTPAGAQSWPIPWDGFWRNIHETCETAARYHGRVTLAETSCEGVSAAPLTTPGAWEVVMDCAEEGRDWRALRIVLLGEDRMWIWFGPGGAVQEFSRCAGSSEY